MPPSFVELMCCRSRSGRTLARAAARAPLRLQAAAEEQQIIEGNVVVRVLSASLEQGVGLFGYADLYVTVEWIRGDGAPRPVARTPTLWMDSTSPVWQFECPALPHTRHLGSEAPADSCARAVFQVMHETYGGLGTPVCCGCANVAVDELLEDGVVDGIFAPRPVAGLASGRVAELPLCVDDEVVGTFTVQVVFREHQQASVAAQPQAPAEASGQHRGRTPSMSSAASAQDPECTEEARALRAGARAGKGGAVCHVASNSTATPPSDEEDDEEKSAARLAEAMLRNWSNTERNEAMKQPANKDAKPKTGHGAKDSERGRRLQELVKLLRVTAKKYPRQGRGLFSYPKDRFFAVTGPQGHRVGDPELEALELTWYEDQSTYSAKDAPLGSISVSKIASVVVEPPTSEEPALVAIGYGSDRHMEIIFGSTEQAETFSNNFNEFLALLHRSRSGSQ